MNELKPEDVMDNHTKEKVICPWCKEEMRPYPHQGYYWFECKCGARTPKLWHATQEQTREKALSYAALLREKDEQIFKLENRLKECENGYDGTLHLERCKIAEKDAEIERLKKEMEVITEFAERLKKYYDALKSGLVSYHIDQIAKEMREKT